MENSNLTKQEEVAPVLSNSNRRRFVRGVGVIAPVVLTVSARSALACHCTSVSAAGSIALQNSHNAKTDVWQTNQCAGFSPSRWKNERQSPRGGSDRFDAIFPLSGIEAKWTMWQVLKDSKEKNQFGTILLSADKKEMLQIFAAAYLNSTSNKIGTQYYDVEKLKAMWRGKDGAFAPVPGKLWDWSDIKSFLLPTMY